MRGLVEFLKHTLTNGGASSALKWVNKLIAVGLIVFIGSTVHSLLNSNYAGDLSVLTNDEKGFALLRIHADKMVPQNPNKNTIDVSVNNRLTTRVGYRRKIGDIWGFSFSVGPDFYRYNDGSSGAGVGVSISF